MKSSQSIRVIHHRDPGDEQSMERCANLIEALTGRVHQSREALDTALGTEGRE